MAIFKNVFRRLRFWKRTSTEPVVNTERDITRTLKQYEYFVYKAQHILLWESPSETLCTVAVVNLFFWFFASLEWRFYGIIFTALLMTTLHEMWTQEIWPEIRVHEPVPQIIEINEDSPQDESLIRLSRFIETSQKLIKDYYNWLKNMRDKRPGVFCSLMSGVFFSLSIVGRMIPGLVLVYLLVMICLFAPGIWVHLIPEETKKMIMSRLTSFHYAMYHTDDLPGEEEYLPEATNEELSLLSQFVEPENEDINSRGSSGTQLSFATSFMPSHDDTSVDSLATFSDLDLNLESAPKTVYDVDDFSDDSSVANDIGIDFQNRHFNGDESSSDEEEEKEFREDLKFTETTDTGGSAVASGNVVTTMSLPNPIVPDSQTSLSNFIPSNLVGLASAFGQTYLANVLNRGGSGRSNDKTESKSKNNSSDSLASEDEFEMISHEDVS